MLETVDLLLNQPLFPQIPELGTILLATVRAITALLGFLAIWRFGAGFIRHMWVQYHEDQMTPRTFWQAFQEYWSDMPELKIGVLIAALAILTQLLLSMFSEVSVSTAISRSANKVTELNGYAALINVSFQLIFFGLSKIPPKLRTA